MTARFFLHILILLMVWFPVSGLAAPLTSTIVPGLNLTGVTAALVAGQPTAFPLLLQWKPSGVTAIERYDAAAGKFSRAELDGGGNPSGVDFPLLENSALYVYSTQQSTLSLGSNPSCAPLDLTSGFNLISHACFPPNYQASEFFTSLGLTNITSLSRLDLASGRWQTAAVDGGKIVGDDFALVAGEGYIIYSGAISGWTAPLPVAISLSPATLTVQQGQPGAELVVSLSTPAPPGGTAIDLLSSDPALVSLAAQVTVPQGSSSVTVPLTVPDTGLSAVQSVTVTASHTGLTGAQAGLSVHPKPTVNLSPLSTLTGLTFTYLLTVNLSDVAPPGGFPVTLSTAPAGIVSLPASITVPAGSSSTPVNVTAIAVGSAVITATSPGRGISGSQNSVTVKPIQTVNYGPLTSSDVGVQVGPVVTTPPNSTVTYTPVASSEVGVAVGPVFTGVSPNRGAIGSSALPLRINGFGLNAVTGISFIPPADITVGTLFVAPDGQSVTVPIDIAANAAIGDRTVLVTTATGSIRPTVARADIFKVTLLTPEILSVQPIRAMAGQIVTMTIFGRNFGSASSVDFTPSDGISVSNPPTVSTDGTLITVTFDLAANAPLGDRVVTVTTPGGITNTAPTPANTFRVTSDSGTTYTSLLSGEVGVLVGAVTSLPQNTAYGPIASQPVGVTVGSTVTAIAPVSGSIGSTALKVRALGVGLGSATAMSFYPPDGITIQAGSFAIGGDGNPEVIVDIASNAPLTPRKVLVALPSGYAMPTDAGSDQFRVTLPQPEIYSVQPIRAMVGQTVAMTIFGKNFGSATSVDFTPSTGISVSNPPAVSPDGSLITVNFTIAANAPLGNRIVTVTTPGGVTSALPSVANTFSVTSDQGITYMPLVSGEVGVLVSGSGSNLLSTPYGPVASAEVGVTVIPANPPPVPDTIYTPLVSAQVGVVVGRVFTGLSPAAMEPGSTVAYTLTGEGLGSVTAVNIIPATDLTVASWAPAGDGRSGMLTIVAAPGAAAGKRTIVPMIGGSALAPSVAGVDILLIGYRPVLNSITTTFPASSVQATVGTTVTLTLNGTHLQEVTRVEVIPADGITVDSMPTWFSDGTGEHVSVKIVVDSGAPASYRLIRLFTPYGSTSATPDITNTLEIFRPAVVGSVGADTPRLAANEPPAASGNDSLTVTRTTKIYGLTGRKLDGPVLQTMYSVAIRLVAHSVGNNSEKLLISLTALPYASRGPPAFTG